jgi:hypothetical protein
MTRTGQGGIRFPILHDPAFRVISVWLWWFVGAALTVLAILAARGVSPADAGAVLGEQRHLAVYIEIVSVGLLPLVISLVCRDDPAEYGLASKGLWQSLLLSLLFVGAMFGYAYLTRGALMSDDRPPLAPGFPSNLWYGLLGILAWGPLEVFFVVWLVRNTENLLREPDRLVSWGLALTVVIFGALHVITTDLTNALYTSFIFLVLMLIHKRTGNAIGPMLAWTLVNGQVWYIARLLV